jgi:O-antigen/teichoic acid export membrane protein
MPLDGQTPLDAAGRLGSDSLSGSVLLLVALTVLQRGVGFFREIFSCRWLSPEQLGLWDMAFGFLMLAGPLAVLSLPGSFGRYVERYRQQGQLRVFLRRTATFCGLMAVPAVAGLVAARRGFAYLIFGTPQRSDLVVLLGASLLVIIAFNYLICLLTALRNIRLVSAMELSNSLLFAVLGLGLMALHSPTVESLIVAYALACLGTVVGGLTWLARAWPSFPKPAAPLPHRELWTRLLPFASWLMLINLLWNLFDVVDRYMIVHFAPGSPADVLAEVGNYRSSRVLPLLLSSVTVMIATAALPHWSHDWEAGHRLRVSDRLNLLLKVWAIVLTAGAVAIRLAAPLLFQVAFQRKFAGGLSVLPWTLTYCTWFGLTMIAQNYLWCAEKASRVGFVVLTGVIVNVVLNCLLLPRLGLLGAVLATTAANATALGLMVALARHFGFRVHSGTVTALLLPVCIPLPPWIAVLLLATCLLELVGSDHLLSADEKHELRSGAGQYWAKLAPRRWLPLPGVRGPAAVPGK